MKKNSATRAFTHHAALKTACFTARFKRGGEGGSHLTSFAVYRGAAQVPLHKTGDKLDVFIMSDMSAIMQETNYENAASDCAVILSVYPPPINRFYSTFSLHAHANLHECVVDERPGSRSLQHVVQVVLETPVTHVSPATLRAVDERFSEQAEPGSLLHLEALGTDSTC